MKTNLFSISLLALALTACNGGNKEGAKEQFLRPAEMEYSSKDTTEIMNLVNQYVECIKNKDFQAASNMLYVFHSDSVAPYTEAQKDSFLTGMKQIPIYDCKLTSFTLRSEKNNQVGMTIQLIPDGDIEAGVGVSQLYLNPVMVDGHWYLTVLDLDAEGVKNVYETRE